MPSENICDKARADYASAVQIVGGFDNFIRPGSETNREPLAGLGFRILTVARLRRLAPWTHSNGRG